MRKHRFDLAAPARFGIDIAGISDESGMDELFETCPAAPRGRRQLVLGQPPAGIEGHAEAADFPAPDQRLEAHLRGDGIDGLRLLDQANGVAVFPDKNDARIFKNGFVEIAPLLSREDIRMRLDDHGTIRIFGKRGIEHAGEARLVRLTMADGRVSEGLVADEHISNGSVPRGQRPTLMLPGMVVFGNTARPPGFDQFAGPDSGRRIQRFRNQLLEPRRTACVVIDPDIVDDERQWRIVTLNRAQEAVFQQKVWHADFRGHCQRPLSRWLGTPTGYGCRSRRTAHEGCIFAEENAKMRNTCHAPGGESDHPDTRMAVFMRISLHEGSHGRG